MSFIHEAHGMRAEEPPPTAPVDFAHELAEFRACVQELERENHDMRSQLHRGSQVPKNDRANSPGIFGIPMSIGCP